MTKTRREGPREFTVNLTAKGGVEGTSYESKIVARVEAVPQGGNQVSCQIGKESFTHSLVDVSVEPLISGNIPFGNDSFEITSTFNQQRINVLITIPRNKV